jgi:hypothetical protein
MSATARKTPASRTASRTGFLQLFDVLWREAILELELADTQHFSHALGGEYARLNGVTREFQEDAGQPFLGWERTDAKLVWRGGIAQAPGKRDGFDFLSVADGIEPVVFLQAAAHGTVTNTEVASKMDDLLRVRDVSPSVAIEVLVERLLRYEKERGEVIGELFDGAPVIASA